MEAAIHSGQNTRSLQANAICGRTFTDISRQVVWHGNKLSPVEWKDVISAGLKGAEGRSEYLRNRVCGPRGKNQQDVNQAEMSDMIELCLAFGIEHGVKFKAEMDGWMKRTPIQVTVNQSSFSVDR